MKNDDPIENKKEKTPKIETSKLQLYTDQLYEQIYDPKSKTCYFCTYDPETKEQILDTKIEHNGIIYYPLLDQKENERPLETGAILLPSGIEPYTDVPTLEKEINDYIHTYVDVSDDHRQKATWYIMLSWVYDNINTIPYLRALGDYGTGKTRYEDVIGGLCYKPMFVGGAVRTPPIYRIITRWRGTAIFDEFTLGKSDETEDVIKILNNGYQRGKPVIRCSNDNYENVKFFDPFCPKVISSRKQFYDQALESRCITEIMKETGRTDIPIDLTKTFYEERLTLRNKLLLYRFNTWNKINPDETINIDFGHIQPRIKQSFLPFTVLFQHDTDTLNHFIQGVKEYNNQLVDDNSSSLDGCIINCYLEQLEYTGNNIITVKDIKNTMVNQHGYKDDLNVRTIGKHMKALGFTSTLKKREGEVKRILEINSDRIEHLIYRYVPTDEQPRLLEMVGKNLNLQTELNFSIEKIDVNSDGTEVT